MKYLLALLTILTVSGASARPIEVRVRDYGWATPFPPIRDILDFYVQGVEDDVNAEQPIIDPARFNYGTANSSVLASKGLGTDYVNEPETYILSLGAGVAWDNERDVAIRDEISGAAAASSLTLGKRFDERLLGFVSFGTFKYSDVIPGGEFDIAGEADTLNFGVHVRYDLKPRSGDEWSGWGGVKLHLGYEFNRNEIELTSNIDRELEVDTGGAGVLSGRLTGRPVFEVETQTHSFPVELSTSVYFLKVISFYGGVGMDINFGASEGTGDVEGDVTTLACTSGVCVSETVLPQLEVQANYDARSTVRSFTVRGFGGVQVDLPGKFHAFGQADRMIGTEVVGYKAGVKYSF